MGVGSLCGRDKEVCEQLRKKKVDMCCLPKVRWRGQEARFVGIGDTSCGGLEIMMEGSVGTLVKEELGEKVVEVRRQSDRVMAMVLVFEEEVIRVICVYAPQVGRSECEKDQFYNDMASGWYLQNPGGVVLGMWDFNGLVGRRINGFQGVHGGYRIGNRKVEERRLLEFCDEKELRVANTWFEKKEQRKIIHSMSGNETEIDFVLVGKNNRKYFKNVKAISWEFQHRLVITDIDKRLGSRKKTTLKQDLIDVDALNLWNTYKNSKLQACDEVCAKKKGRKTMGIHGGRMNR